MAPFKKMLGFIVGLMSTAVASPARPAGPNMNGEYTIANGLEPKPGVKPFSTQSSDYDGGVEYFDVYTPEIRTKYSQVWWTMMDSVALPADIVARFDGKVMAVTGMEADQVMDTPDGEVSVPITWAYNHHYGQYLNGKDSVLEEVELQSFNDRNGFMGHALPGEKVWITRPRDNDTNPTSPFPASTVFATGNGGEFRKSFHSYPAPYAQLVESPVSWAMQPMQIDTKNRDGSMAHPGMPFSPGPYPHAYNAPRTGPDAVYSDLLECPCTDRISRSVGPLGAPTTCVDKTCAHAIASAAECATAAANLAQLVAPPSSPSPAPPASCPYTEHPGTFLAAFAPGAPTGGWSTLPPAQAWCCAHEGCGGVTFQDGTYTARAGTAPTPFKLNGLSSWVFAGSHSKARPFNFSTGASSTLPAGCSLSITTSTIHGFFNTATRAGTCGGPEGERTLTGAGVGGDVGLALALDEAGNKVTITLTGPADVWFGVGFDAEEMASAPYAVVVDGAGNVSEHKLGNHAPGIVLQPSVALVSSTVSGGTRTVVLTRKLKMADYENNYYDFDITQTSLPYITAVGSGPIFAYHKSHAVATLALFADSGATCVCAGASPPFGKTASGTLSYSAEGKNCVGECDPNDKTCTKSSSMLAQKNPTCDVRTYVGGLGCCHHLYFLLDKNQSHLIPEEELVYRCGNLACLYVYGYRMKMRFYFQEYNPSKHMQLFRWHWQTAMGAGEYDVPKCAPGTPPAECVHTITAKIQVSDFAAGPCDTRSGLNVLTPECKPGSIGFKPIFLGGHCHAPTCLSMELFNADTGELICRNVPTFGNRTANATGVHRFDESGYLALPPCVWGDPAQGLPAPPLLLWNTTLSAIKRCNSTYSHTGEMARWQGHGVIV